MKVPHCVIFWFSISFVWLMTVACGPSPQNTPNQPNLGSPSNVIVEEPQAAPEPAQELDYMPTQDKGSHLLRHRFYAVSYSTRHKNPEWVAYVLTKSRLAVADLPRRQGFLQDPQLELTAQDDDYTNSGYDRGHLAPAHDMSFSELAMEESFFMSNVTPQVPAFNRGIWKVLENQVREWAETEKRLYIITGPILRSRLSDKTPRIGEGVTVPRGFYKVILDYDQPSQKGIAFMFKNKEIDRPLQDFAVSIDEVEEYTGIDFFPRLSEEEQAVLESKIDLSQWNFD